MEASRDEVDALSGSLDTTKDELNARLSALKLEQDLTTKLREQLNSLGEDRERSGAENKALKTSLNELSSKFEDVSFALEKSEEGLKKWKMDAEILAEKLRGSIERGTYT